jgi:two-component system sensor histidine kinase DesK
VSETATAAAADHAAPGRRWRLLPAASDLGWTPYVWLVYLGIFLAEPALRLRAGVLGAVEGAAVVAGSLLFLVVYFRGFWVRGRALLAVVATLCALGVALAPVTVGSAVFFTYGASFAGNLDRPRTASWTIVGVAGLAVGTSWLVGVPPAYLAAAAGLPLMIGFVNVHHAEGRRATARLRLAHAQIEHLAAVAERERIARDLHDILGHTLSLVVLKAELAGKLVPRDPARALAEIRDVESVSRTALRDVREAIRGYRASLSDEIGRARALLQTAGIAAELDVAAPALAPAHEEVLALALREAVTNVTRHSGASACRVRLVAVGGDVVLRVDDDGAGRRAAEGAGLRGMRERVEAHGGSVVREASADGGWSLTVRLPDAASARAVPAAVGARAGTGA